MDSDIHDYIFGNESQSEDNANINEENKNEPVQVDPIQTEGGQTNNQIVGDFGRQECGLCSILFVIFIVFLIACFIKKILLKSAPELRDKYLNIFLITIPIFVSASLLGWFILAISNDKLSINVVAGVMIGHLLPIILSINILKTWIRKNFNPNFCYKKYIPKFITAFLLALNIFYMTFKSYSYGDVKFKYGFLLIPLITISLSIFSRLNSVVHNIIYKLYELFNKYKASKLLTLAFIISGLFIAVLFFIGVLTLTGIKGLYR